MWDKVLITLIAAAGVVAVIVGVALLLALPTMWVWNVLMPDLFGLPTIDIWQAICLNILAELFFKGRTTCKKGD